jgi:DNA-binding transcriptional MocR family regulator
LILALRTLTSPGDVVIVKTPAYQGILQTIAALNLRIIEFPQDPAGGIHMERLETMLAAEPVRVVVVVPNFSNPSGRTLDDTTKKRLLAACERHGTVILEDDVYGELAWDDSRPPPLRRWDSGGTALTCSSFSKFLAPGLRVGRIVGGRWTDELSRAKYFSTIGSPALPQLAISNYLERHDLERGLRKLRRGLSETALRMESIIRNN